MAKFELTLPKMGESVAEATITSWLKEVGDTIELDEAILEIATDKVDSEVPSEVEGVLVEKLFNVGDVVQVGQVLAVIETESEVFAKVAEVIPVKEASSVKEIAAQVVETIQIVKDSIAPVVSADGRFYSPLVKNIAKQEGISQDELDEILGTS